MTTRLRYTTIAALLTIAAAGSTLHARQDPAKPAPPPAPPRLSTKVDVVITRSQGEKKVSSLPFTLLPTSNARFVSLRVGVDVPIGSTTTTRPPEGNREGATTTQPTYRNIGTQIDCSVSQVSATDPRFDVYVSVSDSSIFTPDADARAGTPKTMDPAAFRTFSASNNLTMKDGQTMLLATGVDKITGETLKVEVTFSVIK